MYGPRSARVIKNQTRHTYILILYLPRRRRIRVGRLGIITFESGIYFYVGSGGRSPLKRLGRHLAKAKKKFWHIDFLTVHSKVVGAIVMESRVSLECQLARALTGVFASVDGFGSSDCRCPSHLFFTASAPRCGSPPSSI